MKLLEGKVSIVTGAARGIGAAIALKLAEHGSHIAFTYVSDSSAEKAAALETQYAPWVLMQKPGKVMRVILLKVKVL